jgi:DNA polymerase III epsilon subunit-like protein
MSLTDPSAAEMPAPSEGDPAESRSNRRPRYGRRRGRVPVGDAFVTRLGPAGEEPFAAIDDPDEELVHERPGPDTPIDDLRFVALDCETTGQSPHRLVELGAVAFTLERHVMSFETLVHSNDRINPFARRIHGISPETLGGAPPVMPVLQRFRRFAHGAVLVEHSADAFDTRLISQTLGEDLDADNLDTSRLAGRLWELKDTIGLERLCRELGVEHRRPHHALADAEATMGCFIELIKRGREQFGWQPPPPRWMTEDSDSPRTRPARRRRRGGRRHRGPGTGPVDSAAPDTTPPAPPVL